MKRINCGFSRVIRKKGQRKTIQQKNVTGIKIRNPDQTPKDLRLELMGHKPEGDGWKVCGYVWVEN